MMLVLHLDPLRSTLVEPPKGVVAQQPSVALHGKKGIVAGVSALDYWFQREQTRWTRVVEDHAETRDDRALGALVAKLLGGRNGLELCAVTPTLDLLPGLHRCLLAAGCRLGRHARATDFWCAALDLSAGTYALVQAGWRSARCSVVRWDGANAEVVGERLLPALGFDVLQETLEPIARKAVEESAGVDPLAAPELARSFYRGLHTSTDGLFANGGALDFPWEGRTVPCSAARLKEALERNIDLASGQLERCVADLGLRASDSILLPSVWLASAWSTRAPSSKDALPRSVDPSALAMVDPSRVDRVLHRWEPPRDDERPAAPSSEKRPVRRAAIALLATLVLPFAAVGVWSLVSGGVREGTASVPDPGPGSSPGRPPGIYLDSSVRCGEQITDRMLKTTPGSLDPDTPSEPWHVSGAFAVRDLEPGERLAWEDVAAMSPDAQGTTRRDPSFIPEERK